jgi:hypothetical protein
MKRIKILALMMAAGPVLAVAQPAEAGPSIRFGENGWLMFNYESQLYGQFRDTGYGPEGDGDTTDIYFRRNRLSLNGRVNQTYGFYWALEHQGDRTIGDLEVREQPVDRISIIDAFINANYSSGLNFRIGLTKDPLVREHNEGCFFPLTLDRSLFVYTSLPRRSRDFGVLAWGNVMDNRVQYKVSAMQGLDSPTESPKSSLRYTARGHVSLLEPETLPLYFGTYLGNKTVLTLGAGYQYEPDAVFANVAGGNMSKDYQAWTVDAFLEYPTASGVFTASAAYLETDFDDAYQGADPAAASIGLDGEKNGWTSTLGYMLPGEVGPGKLQFFGRFEEWNFANLDGIIDQEISWYGGGLNYYLNGHDLRLTLQYAFTDFDRETAEIQDFTTVTAMVQLRY